MRGAEVIDRVFASESLDLSPPSPAMTYHRQRGCASCRLASLVHAKPAIVRSLEVEAEQMPKLKTKSGAKKRFKVTANGHVKSAAAGKRHGMIKRTKKFIRNARGTMVLAEPDARIVKKFIPYA